MKKKPIIYKYLHENVDYNISFLSENGRQLINLTEMAKPFNKSISHFLEDPLRYEIVKILCVRNSLSINEIDVPSSLKISELAKLFPESLKIVKGGLMQQGSWGIDDIAIEFARYLSPRFAIWCNDKIKELLKYGYAYLVTTTPDELYEHVSPTVQKKNSKAIAAKNYGLDKNQQNIINHFRTITHKLIGLYPYQIKSWARKNNIPLTIINGGSREVLRYISSSATACMSLLENIIASHPDLTTDNLDELLPFILELEPFFEKMIEIGHYNHKELEKIKKYEILKKNINEN